MSLPSLAGRLAIKRHRRLDWNVGYQYYNYNESVLVGSNTSDLSRAFALYIIAFPFRASGIRRD